MLQPKRTKFRKQHKGRIHGEAKGGFNLDFGSFGLKATEPERVTARQIEAACGKPGGWLDELRKDAAPSSAEATFLELALAAWRSTNSAGRKALREHLKAIAKPPLR